ncbi:hypothetical protein HAX54_038653 [Datura stramonium]|uniref:Uncharacterized protein n=1 Tax=Datura stramonium TaxID=4076 RepID=A0ABS8SI64_DATST|nr:hypothetical protein [Datura stramonium]
MDLVNTLTNVATIANIGMELNMVCVRSTSHGVTNITGQSMLAIATLLATIEELSVSQGLRVSFPHRRRPKIVFGERERVATAQPRSSSHRCCQLRTSDDRSQIDQRENLVLKINSRAVNRRRESAAATVADREQQCGPDRSVAAATSRHRKNKKKGNRRLEKNQISPSSREQQHSVADRRKNSFFSDRAATQQIEREKKKLLPVTTLEKNQAVVTVRSE